MKKSRSNRIESRSDRIER